MKYQIFQIKNNTLLAPKPIAMTKEYTSVKQAVKAIEENRPYIKTGRFVILPVYNIN